LELESELGKLVGVDTSKLDHSVHTGLECIDCHDQANADFEDFPHFETYQPVDCEGCHSQEAFVYMEYFNKMLKKKGTQDIPGCKECHGTHDAHRQLGMELVCDRCHHEQAAAYQESYHFKKYPEDSRRYPICTTCHDAHFKSKREVMSEVEYKQEIVDICSHCHQRDIETYVHSRHYHEMEGGNLKAPVCTSCHESHAIRKPSDPLSSVHANNITDLCNECHPGHKESLHVDPGMDTSAVTCASCHTGHQTDMASIDHQIFKEGGIYNQCNVCHGRDRHAKESLAHGQAMLVDQNGDQANCTKCHVYHWHLPSDTLQEAARSVASCESCHAEEAREYKTSIHGQARAQGIDAAPDCIACHGESAVEKPEQQFTPQAVVDLCASCHEDRELMLGFQINPYVVEGFKDTYHGKLGSHSIKPQEDPESQVNRAHIVETCQQCHPRANDNFVSYLVHPIKPSDEEMRQAVAQQPTELTAGSSEDPQVRSEFSPGQSWDSFNSLVTKFMTVLLVVVMTVAGIHTVLWFQRGIRRRVRPIHKHYKRIDPLHRFLHFLVNVSFLTLAFTGLPQSYAHTDLAKWMFSHIMPLKTAQLFHYWAAAITGLYFAVHIIFLLNQLRKIGLRKLLTGPDTLMFRWKDVKDGWQHLKWFFGSKVRPRFDRWTYWEKFDYFAVFWGVFVIGLSGLIRWQDEFFGSLLGGGIISLADTIHKEEALLATAFIFVVHFFNTHLRARKFPMDVSIYTGSISEKEYRDERPLEYERVKSEGRLAELEVKPPSILWTIISYAWGTIALLIGFFLLALIIVGHLTTN
jgi:predicted CXXCH cytochrome family protein